ncbi:class I SAM-dependent methyltransferase [Adhaeribacter aquaticus]|uniref:class I SAM-dependent methyltransferase n=1 Tax=Adhaeribacter aquaticus TaxID=299567 RepID=UPI0003F687C2|nr:class I SAM-dependent methyltransferase [Adhaeribacter aquaticus]
MRKTNSDVLGNALQDYFSGEKDAFIEVESSITETEKVPVAYFFRSHQEMPEIEQRALEMCRGQVLDVGAGAGSHSLYLQQQGLDVTAMDHSAGACAIMRARGVKKVKEANFVDLDDERYDTILMLMNGIGLVGDLDGLKQFLFNIKNKLKPGGAIVVDSSDITYMFYDEEGALCLDLNADYRGVVTYQMIYKGEKGLPFKWLFIDFPLFQEYAEEAGFKVNFIQEDEHYHYLMQLVVKE